MYLPLISSVIVFGVIVLILVTILTIAEKRLIPQGDVDIIINDNLDKKINRRKMYSLSELILEKCKN